MSVVAVVGLGYVGLPLAVAFGKLRPTVGYDLSTSKIAAYRQHIDPSGNLCAMDMLAATDLTYTADPAELANADNIIIAVPTPIDAARKPDFGPLIQASQDVGQYLRAGATIIFESTVYPGATEEVCIPILEQTSGMQWKKDFHVGYSPERINPGDQQHTLRNTIKVVAGDTPETLARVAALYGLVVETGVHRVSSIKVAEATKDIENTQRDLNIGLMNELAVIFNKMDLHTLEVLEAAGTKWNFFPFRPSLVSGHCIGVDPYYLTYKAEMLGYHPEVILAGRRINDSMGIYIAEQTIKQMIQAGSAIKRAKVNVLDITFKEDVPDMHNSKVMDLITELRAYGAEVFVYDPVADAKDALLEWDALPQGDALVLGVAHCDLLTKPAEKFAQKLKPSGCFVDVKGRMNAGDFRAAGLQVWRLEYLIHHDSEHPCH